MENIIAEKLFDLVYSNVYASNEIILTRALKNRFVGFRAEIELNLFMARKSYNAFEGGYILPLRGKKKTLSAPIYFTIDDRPQYPYKPLYKLLNTGGFAKLLYIKFDSSISLANWNTSNVLGTESLFPIPQFTVFDFQEDNFIELRT